MVLLGYLRPVKNVRTMSYARTMLSPVGQHYLILKSLFKCASHVFLCVSQIALEIKSLQRGKKKHNTMPLFHSKVRSSTWLQYWVLQINFGLVLCQSGPSALEQYRKPFYYAEDKLCVGQGTQYTWHNVLWLNVWTRDAFHVFLTLSLTLPAFLNYIIFCIYLSLLSPLAGRLSQLNCLAGKPPFKWQLS